MTATRLDQTPRLRVAIVTAATALVAVTAAWLLLYVEVGRGPVVVSWPGFFVISALLLVCERVPSTWIRFGPVGVVTPRWMFASALLLMGSPAAGVGVAVLGATLHSVHRPDTVTTVVTRIAGTAISLSIAGLILFAFDVDGAITAYDSVPWKWGLAIVFAGAAIVSINAVVGAIELWVRRRMSFGTLLRRGLAFRITAEGAIVSLAPIWLVGIHFSIVLAPLLAITTYLVFRSTRQALERAHEAHHDQLTGLLNRRAFLDQLGDALDNSQWAPHPTVLLMDLNGFKEVNDRLGHQIGDVLLVSFADRLMQSTPDSASVARLGGDEFAVMFFARNEPDQIATTVEVLHAQLSRPLEVEGFPVSVGVSIGVASAPADGTSRTDLLRAADVAMYKAKRLGSPIERYDNCVKTPQRGRLTLLGDLSDALTGHQLHIHFQPQLRMCDGTVDTVEALIRWQHPVHGAIPPTEFIGLAEQTDLIGPLTEFVLRAATRGLLLAHTDDVKLAVNVSARSLQESDFADTLFALLADAEFPPERLELEVTERAIVTNAERSSYTIDRLRQAGIRIAIDDFGAGYSSYQTLRLLDVDRVKIDRDFVRRLAVDRRDQIVVASLIKLAHDLELDVVAEGVENADIWDALAALDCDIAQGYGIAEPMAFPDLRGWLSKWNEVLVEELVATTTR
jgi:diguanylate cyclase (GGDEF)-like protein